MPAGRPALVPKADQRKIVESLAAFGVPVTDIAKSIGISPPSIRRLYRHELDTAHIRANAKVAGNLFRMATGTGREAAACAMFWMKTRCGWQERYMFNDRAPADLQADAPILKPDEPIPDDPQL